MASTLCAFRTRLLLPSLDPHVTVEAVDEAADTVVSEERVRCRGDSNGAGGGVGGGEMLDRLELTAESLSLSSSTEWRPAAMLLLPVGNLYSKLRSDLGTEHNVKLPAMTFLKFSLTGEYPVQVLGHHHPQECRQDMFHTVTWESAGSTHDHHHVSLYSHLHTLRKTRAQKNVRTDKN
jgi:hypothetical protein